MKRIVLKFGLLSGGAAALMMFATVPFIEAISFERSAIVGYTAIVISFLFVYFGIRAYRDTVLDGTIGFFRGVGVGLLITLISSACYVIAWEIIYYNFMPDFLDRYFTYMLDQMQSQGAPQADIDAAMSQADQFRRLYANPFTMAAITLIEPMPVGVIMTLLSAAVLRRTKPRPNGARAVSSPGYHHPVRWAESNEQAGQGTKRRSKIVG